MRNFKKLVLSGIALSMATLITAGSTFAWFTSNSIVSAGNLEINVQTNDDENNLVFNVSKVGHSVSEYFNSVDMSATNLFDDVVLDAVTTKNGKDYYLRDENSHTYEYGATTPATPSTAEGLGVVGADGKVKTADYATFDVHFRSNVQVPVYLNAGSYVKSDGAVPGQHVEAWDNFGNKFGSDNVSQFENLTPYACNATRILFTQQAPSEVSEGKIYTHKVLWAPNEYYADGGLVGEYGIKTDVTVEHKVKNNIFTPAPLSVNFNVVVGEEINGAIYQGSDGVSYTYLRDNALQLNGFYTILKPDYVVSATTHGTNSESITKEQFDAAVGSNTLTNGSYSLPEEVVDSQIPLEGAPNAIYKDSHGVVNHTYSYDTTHTIITYFSVEQTEVSAFGVNPKGYWKNNLQGEYIAKYYGWDKDVAMTDVVAELKKVNTALDELTSGELDDRVIRSSTVLPRPGTTVYGTKTTSSNVDSTHDNPFMGYTSNWYNVAASYGVEPICYLIKNNSTGFYEGTVTVTVWLEGTDGDCFNAILNQSIDCGLSFSNYKKAEISV